MKIDILSEVPEELLDAVIAYIAGDERGHLFLLQCCLVCKTWNNRINGCRIWITLGEKHGLALQPGNTEDLSYEHDADDERPSLRTQFFRLKRLQRYQRNVTEMALDLVEYAEPGCRMYHAPGYQHISEAKRLELVREHGLSYDTIQYNSGFVAIGTYMNVIVIVYSIQTCPVPNSSNHICPIFREEFPEE